MPTETPALLTPDQLAEELQVTKRTIGNWTAEKIIPFHRFGRAVRYSLSEVLEATKRKPRKF